MDKVVPKGYMQDAHGRLVPEDLVKEEDKLRNSLVMEIVFKAAKLSNELAAFKASAMQDVKAFVALAAEKYKVKIGGRKGNITLHSYDGEYRVIIAISDSMVFDEKLHAAKALIDDCMTDWCDGSKAELKTVINGYFNVGKQGRLDTKQILSLRELDIKDDRWQRAMEALNDSLQVAGSKEYIRIYKRNETGDYKQVNLDLAAL